ncbi:MAG: DUF1736 domain-containing protein [Acidobacteriota bacterium]|nr:MAG: DUF1736 domain-containing protein [Acidobacteriota bacterium]
MSCLRRAFFQPLRAVLLDGSRQDIEPVGWIVAALALAATLGTLPNGWTLDASVDVLANRFVTGPISGLDEMLVNDYTAGSGFPSGFWRPLLLLAYWVLWRLGAGTPIAFFGTNVLLHLGVSLGVLRLARMLGGSLRAAGAATMIFAVHPVHTDATAGVVVLKDLMAAAGFVSSLLLLLSARTSSARRPIARSVLGIAVFLAALLSKESALSLIPCLLVLDLADLTIRKRSLSKPPRRTLILLQYGGLLVALGLKLGSQYLLLGSTFDVAINPADNPLSLLSVLSRRVAALALIPLYARLLVWPSALAPDYSYDSIPLCRGFVESGALLGLLIALGALVAAVWALWKRERLLFAGLGILAACYLLVSNLVVTLGTNAVERFAYLPSIGFCLVTGWLLGRRSVPRRIAWALVVVIVVAGLVRTEARNRDWRNPDTLWAATTKALPRNIKAVFNASLHLARRGEGDQALLMLERALDLDDPCKITRPILEMNRPALRGRYGAVLSEIGRHEQALEVLRDAIAAGPLDPGPRIHLARVLNRLGRRREALAELDAAGRLRLTSADLHLIERERQLASSAVE